MSAGEASPRRIRPRDASTLILLDRSQEPTRVLMGKRHSAHKFMPGKFVFPGGAVDPADWRMSIAASLDAHIEHKLMLSARLRSPGFARALALAALRETFEETGLALGVKGGASPAEGPQGAWARFASTGVRPTLDRLDFLARAITPPGRTKRFDTRFFVADAGLIAHRVEGVVNAQAELVELVWTPLDKALELDIPVITRAVLADLNAAISGDMSRHRERPFYRQLHRRWRRDAL